MALLTGFPQIFQSDTSATASSQELPLGVRAADVDGNEYIYAKGTASVVKNTWVTFDEGLNVTRTAANAQGRIGIAMVAIPLSSFGWYQVRGKATGSAVVGVTDNGKLYLTSTAGEVGTADVSGDFIVGAIGRSDRTSGSITVELLYPIVQDTVFD
mgnify:CR=1 FL=1